MFVYINDFALQLKLNVFYLHTFFSVVLQGAVVCPPIFICTNDLTSLLELNVLFICTQTLVADKSLFFAKYCNLDLQTEVLCNCAALITQLQNLKVTVYHLNSAFGSKLATIEKEEDRYDGS